MKPVPVTLVAPRMMKVEAVVMPVPPKALAITVPPLMVAVPPTLRKSWRPALLMLTVKVEPALKVALLKTFKVTNFVTMPGATVAPLFTVRFWTVPKPASVPPATVVSDIWSEPFNRSTPCMIVVVPV